MLRIVNKDGSIRITYPTVHFFGHNDDVNRTLTLEDKVKRYAADLGRMYTAELYEGDKLLVSIKNERNEPYVKPVILGPEYRHYRKIRKEEVKHAKQNLKNPVFTWKTTNGIMKNISNIKILQND